MRRLIALATLLLVPAPTRADDVPTVHPRDLTTRAELLGQELIVDGRIDRVDYQKEQGWNLLRLKGTPVLFRLPPRLAFRSPPTARSVQVRGVLRRQGRLYDFDIASLTLHASDLERLERGVAALAPGDFQNRDAWARWAEARAEEYDDADLRQRARALAGEALLIEAARPPVASSPERLLELARRARTRHVPEPIPSSLVHHALRLQLPAVKDATEAEHLATEAAELLPETAATPQAADLGPWQAAYDAEPAATYRRAEPAVRAALDRALRADTLQKALELRAEASPERTLALADRADVELADRPEVARTLRQRALSSTDVSTLRLAEVQQRARLYDSMGQPEEGQALRKRWLEDQRIRRLSPTDAEGRMLLAEQYETLLGDRPTAMELLREAWVIDPQSDQLADAFRRRGYRFSEGVWVPTGSAATSAASGADAEAPASEPSGSAALNLDSYRGRTRKEILGLLGAPLGIARVATQGQIREQWTYRRVASDGLMYIHFVQRPGQPSPVVVSHQP